MFGFGRATGSLRGMHLLRRVSFSCGRTIPIRSTRQRLSLSRCLGPRSWRSRFTTPPIWNWRCAAAHRWRQPIAHLQEPLGPPAFPSFPHRRRSNSSRLPFSSGVRSEPSRWTPLGLSMPTKPQMVGSRSTNETRPLIRHGLSACGAQKMSGTRMLSS